MREDPYFDTKPVSFPILFILHTPMFKTLLLWSDHQSRRLKPISCYPLSTYGGGGEGQSKDDTYFNYFNYFNCNIGFFFSGKYYSDFKPKFHDRTTTKHVQ